MGFSLWRKGNNAGKMEKLDDGDVKRERELKGKWSMFFSVNDFWCGAATSKKRERERMMIMIKWWMTSRIKYVKLKIRGKKCARVRKGNVVIWFKRLFPQPVEIKSGTRRKFLIWLYVANKNKHVWVHFSVTVLFSSVQPRCKLFSPFSLFSLPC